MILKGMEYPVIVKLYVPRLDYDYVIVNSEEELLELSYSFLKHLDNHSEVHEKEPTEDKYPEISNEYIENAPTEYIKEDLIKIRERRERWLSNTGWRNTLREAQQIYDYYKKGLDGDGTSAYYYLKVREWLSVINPSTVESYKNNI